MPRYAIIDDTDPLITYTGNWQILTKPIDPLTPEYNGTVHATNDPNATMSINFWGTVINGYGTLDRPALKGIPSTTWQLDNIDPVNFNQSGTTQLDDHTIVTSHMNVYHSGKFADGQHTLKMKVNEMLPNSQTGEKPMFYFDFFAILAGDPIYVENVLLDNGSQFEYGGSWTTNNATGSYRESLQRTPSDGGVAVVGFHGTEITVYGTLNGTYDPNVTLAYFSINEGPQYAVYLPNITNSAPSTPPNLSNVSLSPTPITLEEPLWHQKIWSTKGLKNIGEFQHTITISIPAQTPGGGGATPTPTPTPTSTGAGAGAGAPLTNAWLFDYVVYGPSSAVGAPTPVLFTTASPSATVIIINNSGAESRKAGAIAGGVIGGLLLVVVLVGVLLWRVRRKRQKTKAERAAKEYSYDQRDQQQRQQGQGQGQQDGNALTPGAGFVAGIATLIPRRKDEKGRYRPEDPPVVREEEGRAGGGGGRRQQRRRRHEEVAEGEVLDISAPSPSGDTTLAVVAANDHNDNSNNNNTNINKSRVGGLELRIPAGRSGSSGDGETSTVMTYSTTLGPLSPNTAASVYDYARPPTGTTTTGARTRVRETDGGVRLASGDEEEFDDTLPPSYARY
ncbi:hypothetical protein FRC17_007348 [Serendipita sp. 399]|nr:hypothetical protein FRC17_007348 [Serendipita sp. 399]